MLIADTLKPLLDRLFLRGKKKQLLEITTARSVLRIQTNDIALLYFDQTALPQIRRYQHIAMPKQGDALHAALRKIAQLSFTQNKPLTLLLSADQYDVHLIESLAVQENEIAQALYWRLKNLITYPIESAATDYFLLPAKKGAPDKLMVSAVTADKNGLSTAIQAISQANLKLVSIAIPELALKQLAGLYEADEKSSVMLYWEKGRLILTISRERTLYFIKRMALPTTAYSADTFEQLVLDIRRSFDYFQSQWRLSAPNRIWLLAPQQQAAELREQISQALGVDIKLYQLPEMLSKRFSTEALDSEGLLLLGAALQAGDAYASPEY